MSARQTHIHKKALLAEIIEYFGGIFSLSQGWAKRLFGVGRAGQGSKPSELVKL